MGYAKRFATLAMAVGLAVFLWACEKQMPIAEAPKSAPATSGASGSSGETPLFLRNTAWPPALQVPFTSYAPSSSSSEPYVKSGPNQLDYVFPAVEEGGKTDGKLHSFFRSCVPFPCVPEHFLASSSGEPLPCQIYMFRDGSRSGRYTAYVYSEPLKQYAIIADGLGPMYPDFLERYHKVNPVPPEPQPPADSGLFVGNPPAGGVLWFRAAGFAGYPETEDLFAPYDMPTQTPQGSYRPPYSFGGKHGQAVYGPWNLQPDFGPETFQPPTGYQPVPVKPVARFMFNGQPITLECPMRFPFDLYDHPVGKDSSGSLEPLRETVMVCTACHASDALEDHGTSEQP
jgi:hypothetical protein